MKRAGPKCYQGDRSRGNPEFDQTGGPQPQQHQQRAHRSREGGAHSLTGRQSSTCIPVPGGVSHQKRCNNYRDPLEDSPSPSTQQQRGSHRETPGGDRPAAAQPSLRLKIKGPPEESLSKQQQRGNHQGIPGGDRQAAAPFSSNLRKRRKSRSCGMGFSVR